MLRLLSLLPPVSVILSLFVVFIALYVALPKRRKLVLHMKHVVITGGSKGIGRELAFCFVEKGCNISIIARNEDDLKV
ncbi:hypothetical protein ANCCAN_14133 [Ancylostoma caninum]|uniref:Oxidoreductase, short chain dehydrogenase/reductase family protein n=1 Tax=Ancylostoma caninum TaxID=29170 RepID=A0A368G674_ANCCA|nr:hypothetical protein ANCCAN_14133 [Ancylostoma caninum]